LGLDIRVAPGLWIEGFEIPGGVKEGTIPMRLSTHWDKALDNGFRDTAWERRDKDVYEEAWRSKSMQRQPMKEPIGSRI